MNNLFLTRREVNADSSALFLSVSAPLCKQSLKFQKAFLCSPCEMRFSVFKNFTKESVRLQEGKEEV